MPSSGASSICGPSTSYSLRFTMVQTVCGPNGHRLANTPYRNIGANGSQSLLMRNGANARSSVATRRVASASRGVIPFQIPQIFSQLSQPTPLKKANCRLSVLSRFQRSEMLTMCRDSSHLYLSTMGTNGYEYWPQVMTFQASASSDGP